MESSTPWVPSSGRGGLGRRDFLRLSALGLGAAGLASCSNFTSGSSGGGGGGGSNGGGTFTFTFWGTGGEKDAVTKVVNDFAQKNGLTARPQSIPDAYETKLNTLLAANNPPDAGYLTQGMAMRLGEQGKIVNVLGQPGFDQFLPSTLHYYAPGKAVSQTAVEVFALWYATEAAKKAGVVVPPNVEKAWSWDDLVQAADKLTVDKNGKHPSDSGFDAGDVKQYGIAPPTSLLTLTALFKSNGVDLFDDAGTRTNIDSAQAIQVMSNIADLIFKHHVAPTPAQTTTFGASTALLLGSGRVAMAIDGQWSLLDLAQSKVPFDVGVLPKYGDYYTTIVSGANGVFAGSKHQKEALELLVALADPNQVPLYSNGLWMPLLKKYYTDEASIKTWAGNPAHPSQYRTAVIDPTLEHTVAYPAFKVKNFSIIETTFNNSINAMFQKQGDMAAQCKALAERVNKLMQGAYPDTPA